MKRRVAMGLTLLAMIAAIALPILLAIQLSRTHVLDDSESLRVLGYARDVLQRSEGAAGQIEAAIKDLLVTAASDPCTPANVARMRDIERSASGIQVVGYVQNDEFLCSSLENGQQNVKLGPVDYKTRFARLRYNVEFPFAPGQRFAVVEQGGYATAVNKDLPLQGASTQKDAILATYSSSNGRPLAVRGQLHPEWITEHDGVETTFFDRGYVVAVVRSRRYDLGAVAALPTAHADQSAPSNGLVMPLAVIVGLLLAFGVFRASSHWQRRSTSGQ